MVQCGLRPVRPSLPENVLPCGGLQLQLGESHLRLIPLPQTVLRFVFFSVVVQDYSDLKPSKQSRTKNNMDMHLSTNYALLGMHQGQREQMVEEATESAD